VPPSCRVYPLATNVLAVANEIPDSTEAEVRSLVNDAHLSRVSPKGQQRLHSRERPVLGGGVETSLYQMLSVGLQIGQRDPERRLRHEHQEPGDIGLVGSSGVPTGLHGQHRSTNWGSSG
jgi:hypothetical protein